MEQHKAVCQSSKLESPVQDKEQNGLRRETLPATSIQDTPSIKRGQYQPIINTLGVQELPMKLKFNISQENLRCFISSSKPQRYRSVSTRISKPSKSAACLPSTKLYLKSTIEEKTLQNSKSQTQRKPALKTFSLKDGQQSDLSRILSNQIIHHIQQKGIYCKWNDIQQKKSEEVQTQKSQDQLYFDELVETFSDKKSARRSSFQQNSSFYQSANSQNNSFVENRDSFCAGSNDQYSNYDNSTYRTAYDGPYEKNFSFASTMQAYSNPYYPMQMYPLSHGNSHGLRSMPSSMFQSNEFIITPEGLGKDPRTTLMIKNIPNKYTIQYLSQQIDHEFGIYYDFLYLPCDTKSGANQGYGFINFVDLDAIKRFYQRFHSKKWKRFRSQKICNLTYARLQGIQSLIQHFQNSKVLNHKEKKYQPIIKSLPQIHHLIKTQQNNHQQQNNQ